MTARKIPSDLAGLRYVVESEFGTDPGSGYVTLRDCRAISFVPGQSMHDPGYQKTSDMRGGDANVVGGKGGTLSFEMPLATNGGSSSDPMKLLQYCGFRLISVAADADVFDGGTTTTLTLADGDVGNIEVGCAIMHVPDSGTPSLRFVERVASNATTTTLTVNADLETACSSGDSLAAVESIVPQSGEPDSYITFLAYQGQGDTDCLRWAITGCSGTAKLGTSEADSLPVIQFEFMVDAWTDSEASIAQADAAGNEPAPLLGDKLFIDGTAVETRSFGFDPGLQLTPIMATSGDNGRSGFFYFGSEPVPEFMPLHDTAWITKWEAGTEFDLCFVSYTASDDAWGVWCPATQVQTYQTADSDGILRGQMGFKVCDPGATADSDLIPRFALAITK